MQDENEFQSGKTEPHKGEDPSLARSPVCDSTSGGKGKEFTQVQKPQAAKEKAGVFMSPVSDIPRVKEELTEIQNMVPWRESKISNPISPRVGEKHNETPVSPCVGEKHKETPVSPRVGEKYKETPISPRMGEKHKETPVSPVWAKSTNKHQRRTLKKK